MGDPSDSSQPDTVRAPALERFGSPESFTADQGYRRQAERAARELLGVELRVTAKPRPSLQKRLRARGHPLAGRAHLYLAWTMPTAAKEYEKTVASAEAWLWCATMCLLVRRLA